MRPEDIFEAFSDIDEELVAGAKHIEGGDSQVIVIKPAPLWKKIAGWGAAAACLAVLIVGGILGIKYFNDKNAVTPPVSGTSDGTSTWVSSCQEYAPPEYPEEAKYVYSGDYSELTVTSTTCIDYVEYYDSIIRLEEKSDLIVIGEFTDDPHQTNDPKVDGTQILYGGDSFNMFRVDRVIKGNCVEGQTILICQDGVVTNGYFVCNDDYTPMLKGDKWIYFLKKSSDREMYFPLHDTGRYPVPGSEHEFVLNDNVYGVFGGSETVAEIYEDIKKRYPNWTYEEYFESEYPDKAELYNGDYSGLNVDVTDNEYIKEVLPYEEIFDERNGCDFIVTGEFIDDTRQWFWSVEDGFVGRSYNKFRVDKVFKGDIKAGQIIIIEQTECVVDGIYYTGDNLTPMIKGDKWLYCLTKTNGICSAYRFGNGRYPIPGSGNKSLDFTDGYYGVCDTKYANKAVYERLLNELGIAVTKDFDGVVLSVMTDKKSYGYGENIKVTATVRNTTDKPIGLYMPCQGENSHTEISTRISRGRTTLVDKDTDGRGFDTALDSHIVQPGEEYVQEMNFVIPLLDSLPSPGYEVGEYKGTAIIGLLSDPNNTSSETTEHLVEFSMMIKPRNIVITIGEFDGVELSVTTDKTFKAGDEIKVTATVRNNTDKPIGLWMPVIGENTHTEISTRISRGRTTLVDISEASMGADAEHSHIVQPGEEYVQEMTFAIPLHNSIPYPGYEVGEYKGTATIKLLSDPNDTSSEITEHLVEFSIMIEGENTGDNVSTEIKRMYDYHTAMDTVDWTMDEFPGVKFRCSDGFVSILTEGVKDADGNELYASRTLYSGMPICDVYLADLNYDGKREIISTVAYGSGIIDEHIEAYDLANDIHYTLWERGYYDYGLKFEDGRLIVEKRKYLNSDVMTEQTLSLDMMYGEKLEALVTSISDKASGGWVMEEFPGVTFYAGYLGISAEKNGVKTALYKDVIVENVLLCDLNGDGKREIISQIRKSSEGTRGVRAYDYANGVCYEYWADYLNYVLHCYNGKLTIDVRTEDYLSSISEFDLRKPDEPEIVIPADKPEGLILPVITWTSLSNFPLENVSKNDYEFVYAIGTIEDEPIYSTVNGEVVAAAVGNTRNYGSYITILGEDGLYYYFCNLSDNGMYVSVGDKVAAGQKIAVPGDIKKWLSTYEQAGFKFIRSNKLLDMANGGN